MLSDSFLRRAAHFLWFVCGPAAFEQQLVWQICCVLERRSRCLRHCRSNLCSGGAAHSGMHSGNAAQSFSGSAAQSGINVKRSRRSGMHSGSAAHSGMHAHNLFCAFCYYSLAVFHSSVTRLAPSYVQNCGIFQSLHVGSNATKS